MHPRLRDLLYSTDRTLAQCDHFIANEVMEHADPEEITGRVKYSVANNLCRHIVDKKNHG